MKTIEKLFGASVGVLSLTTLITTIAGFLNYPLPPWARWAIGIVNLIALPLLIYSTVKSLREKAGAAKKAVRKAPVPKAAAPAEEAKAPVPVKVRPKPHPQQLAARKAAAGNKPKKGRKKKK